MSLRALLLLLAALILAGAPALAQDGSGSGKDDPKPAERAKEDGKKDADEGKKPVDGKDPAEGGKKTDGEAEGDPKADKDGKTDPDEKAGGDKNAGADDKTGTDDKADDEEKPRERPVLIGEVLAEDVMLTPVLDDDAKDGNPPAKPVSIVGLTETPRKPLVLLFWSNGCPVSKRYVHAYAALAKEFRENVSFAFVAVNHDEPPETVLSTIKGAAVSLPVYADPGQVVAHRLGVKVTPTALVVDGGGALRYRGPVDDDRKAKSREPVQHLREALKAVTGGKQVESAEPRAFGSAVRRQPAR